MDRRADDEPEEVGHLVTVLGEDEATTGRKRLGRVRGYLRAEIERRLEAEGYSDG